MNLPELRGGEITVFAKNNRLAAAELAYKHNAGLSAVRAVFSAFLRRRVFVPLYSKDSNFSPD